jgi:hypothetical protein
MFRKSTFFCTFLLFLSACQNELIAHAAGENYVFISVQTNGLSGRFEFHADDLQQTLGLEFDDETPEAYLAGIESDISTVHSYINENFTLSAGGQRLMPEFSGVTLVEEVQQFAQFHFTIALDPVPDQVDIARDSIAGCWWWRRIN